MMCNRSSSSWLRRRRSSPLLQRTKCTFNIKHIFFLYYYYFILWYCTACCFPRMIFYALSHCSIVFVFFFSFAFHSNQIPFRLFFGICSALCMNGVNKCWSACQCSVLIFGALNGYTNIIIPVTIWVFIYVLYYALLLLLMLCVIAPIFMLLS